MPILDPKKIVPEEDRENILGEVLIDSAPEIPGMNCIRGISPLVMTALQRTNNPYVTGKKGFLAAGIDFEEKEDKAEQEQAAGEFAMAMMPFTAEVLICWTCSREELKKYARDSKALQSAALDFMEDSTMEKLAEATIYVSRQLAAITKSRAVPAPDQRKPKAEMTGGGSGAPKKKHVRTGKPKS